MNAKERYKHLRHSERLLLWQIANVERERAIRRREFKRAWKAIPLRIAIRRVIESERRMFESVISQEC